ncbi:tripartite tricarboxylate transporter substrate-binding protein [Cupriavidus basilensis]
MSMVDLASGAGFIKGGKVKALAVANPTRLPQLTRRADLRRGRLQERGGRRARRNGSAPSGTPPEVIAILNKQVVAAIREPAVNKRLVEFGVEPVGSTPAQFADLLRSEDRSDWHKLIRERRRPSWISRPETSGAAARYRRHRSIARQSRASRPPVPANSLYRSMLRTKAALSHSMVAMHSPSCTDIDS